MRTIPQPPKMLAHDVHWNSINRGIILKDIVDTEKANVAELQGLVDNFLQPLASTNILTEEEFSQLIGNLLEVLEIHEYLLKLLERALLQGSMSKVGDRFLMLASRINEIHQSYCDHHPLAVCILDKYRKELNAYMEEKGAVSPGILVLTTGLSKPLRRLEKYSAMFQELERYTERCHPDKGNVQRCIILYREIAETCASIRRRKELALQVLMGGIEDWDGEELGSIDEILHVGLVTLVMGEELRTRYLVLSPTALHILSTNQTMSSFVYECKLPLGTITITPMANTEETRNAFTISGPTMDSILVLCSSSEEKHQWFESLTSEHNSEPVKSTSAFCGSSCYPPFSRLSRFFARLVRKKVIYPELLKKLLYFEYIVKLDLTGVKMRKCKVEYSICPIQPDSSQSESDASVVDKSVNKTRSVYKSTLNLDVNYATETVKCCDSTVPTLVSESSSAQNGFHDTKSLPGSSSVGKVNVTMPAHPSLCDTYWEHYNTERNGGNLNKHAKNWKCVELVKKDTVSRLWLMLTPTSEDNGKDEDDYEDFTEEETKERNVCTFEIDNSSRLVVTSPRSSDSGMAGSCNWNSSELNFHKSDRDSVESTSPTYDASHRESETEEHEFERQCICASPFDSLPASQNTDRSETQQSSQQSNVDTISTEQAPCLTTKRSITMNRKRFSEPVPYTNQCYNTPRKISSRVVHLRQEKKRVELIFRSGLYAHWWLKKKIPTNESTDQDPT